MGNRRLVANAFTAGLIGGTLHGGARVIAATIGTTGSGVTTGLDSLTFADIGLAGAVHTSLTLGTGCACTWIFDALAIFTTLSLWTGGTMGDTLTVCGATCTPVRAVLSITGVVGAFAV